MISHFELQWRKLSTKNFNTASHFEYLIDGINLKNIIDRQYGYSGFVEKNEFIGWINEKIHSEELETSKQILKTEKKFKAVSTNQSSVDDVFTQIPIYTCGCGDIDCSGIVVNVIFSGNRIIWDFDDHIMKPISFDFKQYKSEIDSKIEMMKTNNL